jgi:hypothetical protein
MGTSLPNNQSALPRYFPVLLAGWVIQVDINSIIVSMGEIFSVTPFFDVFTQSGAISAIAKNTRTVRKVA